MKKENLIDHVNTYLWWQVGATNFIYVNFTLCFLEFDVHKTNVVHNAL